MKMKNLSQAVSMNQILSQQSYKPPAVPSSRHSERPSHKKYLTGRQHSSTTSKHSSSSKQKVPKVRLTLNLNNAKASSQELQVALLDQSTCTVSERDLQFFL